MSTLIRTRRALAASALVVPALLLTACGGDEEAAEKTAEKLIEGAASGDVDVDIDEDGEKVEIETDEGTISVGKGLPDDFPEEITVLEGEVVSSSSMAGQGWTAAVKRDGDPEAERDAAVEALGGGFTQVSEMNTAEMSMVILENDTYNVSISAVDDGETTLVQYIVSPKTS